MREVDIKIWVSDISKPDIVRCKMMDWDEIKKTCEWLLSKNGVAGVVIQVFPEKSKNGKQ